MKFLVIFMEKSKIHLRDINGNKRRDRLNSCDRKNLILEM